LTPGLVHPAYRPAFAELVLDAIGSEGCPDHLTATMLYAERGGASDVPAPQSYRFPLLINPATSTHCGTWPSPAHLPPHRS
jgi:hypothetical protein